MISEHIFLLKINNKKGKKNTCSKNVNMEVIWTKKKFKHLFRMGEGVSSKWDKNEIWIRFFFVHYISNTV